MDAGLRDVVHDVVGVPALSPHPGCSFSSAPADPNAKSVERTTQHSSQVSGGRVEHMEKMSGS